MARIYTKTGDKGDTGLIGGKRALKSDVRMTAIGDVDETNAAIGVVRGLVNPDVDPILEGAQNRLFDLGAELAMTDLKPRITAEHSLPLERAIDENEAELEPLRSFILPGGSAAAAHLHLSRTICRRAERSVVALSQTADVNPHSIVYLNRLSDLLFVLARTANRQDGVSDVKWVPGE
ncbi:MAG: cob(I)yrinic acid a,c-diamide adenosyltransferase [Armatimonadetes bacterium]|nr:cob(I)yrinic acid a,c-diamide adenosyltransferase [Armatimonadota bacterium]